jgi:hypothetical protein
MIRKFAFLSVVSALCSPALAGDNASFPKGVEALRQQGYSITTITPIFSQLVKFSFPKGFVPAFENTKGGHYIQESVLEGESLKTWSQMVTITGEKELASNRNVTPARFADRMAGGFKRVCPDSYSATGLGEIKLGGYDGFVAVVSCGVASPVGESYSESMLLIVIKGESDYYTIQWAERGATSKTPIKFDDAKWSDRLKRLAPVRLCPIVPREPAPYPSCVNRT